MPALPDFSDRYTALVLRTGLGHDWKRTILWFLTHSLIASTWVTLAGLAEYILYDSWTYVWFAAWIFLILLMRRTTRGLNELVGVPLDKKHLYDPDICNEEQAKKHGELGDEELSKKVNQLLHQPLELVVGFGAYALFAIFFIPWSYQGGVFGQHPYPWEDLILITNLIFFFVDYLHFGSACFIVLGLFYSLYGANLKPQDEVVATMSIINDYRGKIKAREPHLDKNQLRCEILKFPDRVRKYGHIVADVTLGALGLVLLLQLYWLVGNTLQGLEVGWSGPLLHIPLFVGALLAFILPQKKLHDTLSPYWIGLDKQAREILTKVGLESEDMKTTVLENTRRYKFGILVIFALGCFMIDFNLFQLLGYDIWTVITIQLAIMGGLIQGWQFIE